MEIRVINRDKKIICLCPFCNFRGNENMVIQNNVSPYFMMFCEKCDALAVLDTQEINRSLKENKIPLLKINKIINFFLSQYISSEKINENITREFIENHSIKNKIPEKIFRDFLSKDYNEIDYNLSLTCDSYNINEPKKPYPKNFNLQNCYFLLSNGIKGYFNFSENKNEKIF